MDKTPKKIVLKEPKDPAGILRVCARMLGTEPLLVQQKIGDLLNLVEKLTGKDYNTIDKDFKSTDVDTISRIDGRILYTKEEWEAKRKKILETPLP